MHSHPAPSTGATAFPLLADGSLELHLDPGAERIARKWLPLGRGPAPPEPSAHRILVRTTGAADLHPHGLPTDPPLLRLGRIAVWRIPAADGSPSALTLAAPSGLHGEIRPTIGSAQIHVPATQPVLTRGAEDSPLAWDLHHALTLAAALLLAGGGRALLHAAAVVDPGGACHLLVGDSRTGKSTTAANLHRLGWKLVSDDQVVLGPRRQVEGWLRPLHLDAGWTSGRRTGTRVALHPRHALGGRHPRLATAASVLLPSVAADRPTRLEQVSPADVLAALIRQSPWLFVHPPEAPRVLETLRSAAELPARRVRLGRDVYVDATPLATQLLAPLSRPGLREVEPARPSP